LDLSDDNVVVGEGRWQTQEPKALVNGLPLGPKAVKVFLDVVHEPETFLWRPTLEVAYLEDSVMTFISWPAHKVVFENPVEARRKVSPTPNTTGLKVPSPGSTGSSVKKSEVRAAVDEEHHFSWDFGGSRISSDLRGCYSEGHEGFYGGDARSQEKRPILFERQDRFRGSGSFYHYRGGHYHLMAH